MFASDTGASGMPTLCNVCDPCYILPGAGLVASATFGAAAVYIRFRRKAPPAGSDIAAQLSVTGLTTLTITHNESSDRSAA